MQWSRACRVPPLMDVDLIDQAFAARKSRAKTTAGAPAVGHRKTQVSDAGLLVLEDQARPALRPLREKLPAHFTTTAVAEEGVLKQHLP